MKGQRSSAARRRGWDGMAKQERRVKSECSMGERVHGTRMRWERIGSCTLRPQTKIRHPRAQLPSSYNIGSNGMGKLARARRRQCGRRRYKYAEHASLQKHGNRRAAWGSSQWAQDEAPRFAIHVSCSNPSSIDILVNAAVLMSAGSYGIFSSCRRARATFAGFAPISVLPCWCSNLVLDSAQ